MLKAKFRYFFKTIIISTILSGKPIIAYASADVCGDLFERRCLLARECLSTEIIDHITIGSNSSPSGLTRERASSWNKATLKALSAIETPTPTGDRKASLSRDEVDTLFRAIRNHPVANLRDAKVKYDPQNIGIGFCFGRAMAAHLEALWNMSLQNASIRKIWAVGELSSGDINWRYHVATMVKGSEGAWWVMDINAGIPLKVEQWYSLIASQYDHTGTMLLYQTEGKRFGPTSNRPYNKEEIFSEDLNNYFIDLLDSYRAQRRERS